MGLKRSLLLASVLGGACLGAAIAQAASGVTDVGSWGQIWGDETSLPAASAPANRSRPVAPAPAMAPLLAPETPSDSRSYGSRAARPAAAPLAAAPLGSLAPSAGPSAQDIGGWGGAWDQSAEGAVMPQARTVASPPPVLVPVPASAPPSLPVAAASSSGAIPSAAVLSPPPEPMPKSLALPAAVRGSEQAQAPMAGASPDGVDINADQIIHDRELGIVTAVGRVEIAYQAQALAADQVSYNMKQDIMSASGNVVMFDPGGNVSFVDHVELTGDFKEGIAKEIRVILADRSRIAGASAVRTAGERTDFDKAVYTACEPCRKHPERRPVWEAKAERITHTESDHTIEYKDVWLELAGVPVLYSPYFSHPDPSVKRKSGFLVPSPSVSSKLGSNVVVPYYWAIADNKDLTLTPRFMLENSAWTDPASTVQKREKDGVLQHMVLAGEYRWLGSEGDSRTQASLTADRYSGHLRGHINAKARFELDDVWRTGFQLQRSTDETYMSRYGFRFDNDLPWLVTRPYVEALDRQNYFVAEAIQFQGLREKDSLQASPLVLPHISHNGYTRPDDRGGFWTISNDMLAYRRSSGTDAARLSSTVGWQRPYYGSFGDITTLGTSMRLDGYQVHEVENENNGQVGRAIPQVTVNWRMPLVRPSRTFSQVLEPTLMVATSPNGGNPGKIPNEDSLGFELDETNVLAANRLVGLDRVEGGVRGAYGLRWYGYPSRGGQMNAMLAQGWRARQDSTYAVGSGFDDTVSDYVGHLNFAPSRNLALYNRVRVDKDTLELRRNENTLSLGSPMLNNSFSYLMMDGTQENDKQTSFKRQHYVSHSIQAELSRFWTTSIASSYNLNSDGGPLNWRWRAIYNDECFAFISSLQRTYTYDRDNEKETRLTFNFVFKTLGAAPISAY